MRWFAVFDRFGELLMIDWGGLFGEDSMPNGVIVISMTDHTLNKSLCNPDGRTIDCPSCYF